MGADVVLKESNGVGPSVAEPSNLNFGSIDAIDLVTSSYPITAGNNSYEKWIRLHVTDPQGLTIDNIKCYLSSGTLKTGESLKTNCVESGYSQASYPGGGPVATTSTEATEDIPTSEPSGPNIGIGGSLSGQITVAGYSDYIVLQLQTLVTLETGSVNQKTLVVQWDEQ